MLLSTEREMSGVTLLNVSMYFFCDVLSNVNVLCGSLFLACCVGCKGFFVVFYFYFKYGRSWNGVKPLLVA